jgi:carbonic anhydrase/acetyltransferase-like protein (isoleucine patch superfamily)
MPSYSIEGVIPVVDPSAYVHPTAVLIGDVIVGPHCYVGPNASLRGDFGRIVLKAGSNVQDTCVIHGFPAQDTVVGENGHIGHGAVLHSCMVGRDALVGMNAVVMDEAVVGERSIVAACAFVPAGMNPDNAFHRCGRHRSITRGARGVLRLNPCPANGATRGACPGWEVDTPSRCVQADVRRLRILSGGRARDHALKTKFDVMRCRQQRGR